MADLATQQLERQADQNRRMSELQQEVASGSRELVEADANARQEMTALQREIQAGQNEIGFQRDQLEAERREIADSRNRDPIIAAAITKVALVVISLLPLLLCWLLLQQKVEPADKNEITELLLDDLVSAEPRLVPSATSKPDKRRLTDLPQLLITHLQKGKTEMSHIVTIQTEVRDTEALGLACRRLELGEPVNETVPLFSGEATGYAVHLPDWRYPVVFDVDQGQVRYDNFEGRWGEPTAPQQTTSILRRGKMPSGIAPKGTFRPGKPTQRRFH